MIKKHAIRRTFKGKKNVNANRHKAPKIQRLVTETRIRRKRIQKEDKIKRWKATIARTAEYKKLHDTWITKRNADLKQVRKASKASDHKPTETKKEEPKKVVPAPVATKVAAKVAEKPKAKK